uniref:Putative chaperonin n=1 Tax=viral metagenome TaxID=1070528 RepID=A0A6M3LBJ9_9ZZZZ
MIEKGQILIGKLLVKEVPPVEKIGSIYVGEIAKPKTFVGEVVIITDPLPNTRTKEPIVPGDMVLHSPHSYVGVTIDGIDYRLLNQADILFTWQP